MNASLRHRGPDDSGVFVNEHISLGNQRLAIIDLSPLGHQPMTTEDGRYTIVYNGELYNFKEIRKKLEARGYRFRSHSDTEVLLAAFADQGPACLAGLNGIFAFAAWDNHEQKLFLARDHVGVKPLYYYFDGQRIIFASEIKAILEHGMTRELNKEALDLYFRLLYVPAPLTIFKQIKKVPAGHYVTLQNRQLEVKKFWDISDSEDFSDYNEARETIRTLFDDAVRRQLISDRPVGIFLSGGIDSTAVLGAVRRQAPQVTETFSTGFVVKEQAQKFNQDFFLARQTAKFYGTNHHELMIGAEAVVQNAEAVAWHLDEPNANSTAAAMYLLSRETKKHVTVVLGGDGGDELFGGYLRYWYSLLISRYQRFVPGFLQPAFSQLLRLIGKESAASKLALPPDARRILSFMAQKERLIQGFYKSEFRDQSLYDFFEAGYEHKNSAADFEKMFMSVDRKTWLVEDSLMRTDKMTMASGLEARVPILDYRLVEAAMRIPTSWKIRGGQGKIIFKEAVKEYLPEHVRNRPKIGWFLPVAKWLREEPMKSFVFEIVRNLPGDYFDIDAVETMLHEHIAHKVYNMTLIWAIVSFGLWQRAYEIR